MPTKNNLLAALYAAKNIYCDSKKPLKGGSGLYQPIYLDHRNLLSYPTERDLVLKELQTVLAGVEFDLISGNETAGIAYAAYLSQLMERGMVYVRKELKSSGPGKQIEGIVKPGQKVLVVDDMMVTGGNVRQAVTVLRDLGAEVADAVVISTVKEEIISQTERELAIKIHYLTTFQEIADYGIANNKIKAEDVQSVREYIADPAGWGQQHNFG